MKLEIFKIYNMIEPSGKNYICRFMGKIDMVTSESSNGEYFFHRLYEKRDGKYFRFAREPAFCYATLDGLKISDGLDDIRFINNERLLCQLI